MFCKSNLKPGCNQVSVKSGTCNKWVNKRCRQRFLLLNGVLSLLNTVNVVLGVIWLLRLNSTFHMHHIIVAKLL